MAIDPTDQALVDYVTGNVQEAPEQSYYPGARLTFIVRFDDPKRKRFNRNPLTLPVTRLKNKYPQVLDMVTQDDGRILLVPKGSQTKPSSLRPMALAIGGDSLTQMIGGIIPLSASLSLNGIRTASTLSAEVAFADLPVEPRMLRGVGVDFYLGTVTAEEYARGMAGETREVALGADEPLNIIPTTYTDAFGRPRTNLRFSGWVDDYETGWSQGAPVVRLQCRDNGAILLDTEAPPMLAIDPKIPLDKAFAKYLTVFPQFGGISVAFVPKGIEAPIYQKAGERTSFKPAFGPPAMTGGKATVLDYLSDLAGHLGLIVRFDGTTSTLIIQRPRTIYGSRFPSREDDPFARTTALGRELPFRLFVWGRNVEEAVMKRKFTVAGPTTIEVRSYSTSLKRYRVVRYPLKKERLERGLPGSLLPDEKIQQFSFPGVKDEPTLRAIAQSIYEQLGRNELELFLRTRDLGSFGGSALDPDLLDCKVGDTVQFEVTNDDGTADLSIANEIERVKQGNASAREYLLALGYSEDFADAYAQAKDNSILQPYFRVKRMEFTWSIEKGIDIGVLGVNYIEVRGDSLPKGEEIEPSETPAEVRKRLIAQAKNFGIINLLKGGGIK